ncbi:MAG: YfhO family protein [Ruminococcus callidus]|nr:YfhO family protein [Ruminococcus callidus]
MMQLTIRKPFSSRAVYKNYLLAFLLGFGALFIVYLPAMCMEHGYFLYYGDYNSQQLPFYELANDAVRSGSFGWNWYTDLGANFIGSYAFYLLGSPFFWLTTILPRSWVLYAMPVLLAMKHGIAAMTAYAYIQRFVRSRNAAWIGGLLYAFSGFQLFNLFFNHFQDVTAFFPLMLIAMEEAVNHNRKGVFALSVALMGCINYFFFTGQAVFLVLYFIVRCFSKDFHATPKKFFLLVWEAVLGVLLACFLLLPSALAILANNRITSRLYGMDLLSYSDPTRIWRIIESFFLIPDVPARPNLFSSNEAKWASIGGYLPLFSMVGVLSFCKHKDGHWAKRLVILCTICAFVPILNSCFYALNGSYYARWFYMPICIMALMTAYVLDNNTISVKYGFGVTALMMAVFGVISILPKKDGDTVTWGSFAEYPLYFYLTLGICVASLGAAGFLFYRRKNGKPIYAIALPLTIAACTFCTMNVVYFGAYTPQRAEEYIDKAIDKEGDVTIAVSSDDFFRIDISKDRDNYPMFWGLPCMRTFHSVVPASIMEFYPEIGVTRDVASRADLAYKAIRYLFSVRYYFDEITEDNLEPGGIDLPGFSYYDTQNGFFVYKNDYALPMGFTFDTYVEASKWKTYTEETRCNLLLRALVLSEEQIEKYGDWMQPLSASEQTMTDDDLLTECTERAETACDTFQYDSKGFQATIQTVRPNLVFFSVPWDEGWSAEVNGEPVEIEKVDTGFMAVPVNAGNSEIVFTYHTPGLKTGALLSLGGLVLFIGYLSIAYLLKKKSTSSPEVTVCCMDYTTEETTDFQIGTASSDTEQKQNP